MGKNLEAFGFVERMEMTKNERYGLSSQRRNQELNLKK